MVFLHEDLVKLPSFPRKALEAELDLFEGGSIGKVLVVVVDCLRINQMAPLARSYREILVEGN